jgi:hypothetical protein
MYSSISKTLLLFAVLSSTGTLIAQEEPGLPLFRNEIGFGVGIASPTEKHPLNVPGEQKVSTSVAINFLYRYHVTSRFSVGVQMFGYTGKTPSYTVQKEGESFTRDLSFTLTSLDLGVQVRYAFLESTIRPYAFGMLNYVAGAVQNDEAGTLNNSGFSAGGGVGVAWMVGAQIALSLEGVGAFGNATWKQRPFLNSSGTEYDPSVLGLLVSVSYFWGE